MKTFEEFKEHIILNHTVENTRTAYLKPVRLFLEHSKGVVTQDTVNYYLLKLREENKKRSTYNQVIISLNKYIKLNKLEIELPKAESIKTKVKEYLTLETLEDEVINMLNLICRDPEKYEIMLRVLFFTGLRVSEFVNLKRKDINFEKERFTIYVSKSEPRRIPFLDKKMQQQMLIYFKYHEEKENTFNISVANVSFMTKKIERELRLDINFTPHVLRASFAKYCNMIGYSLSDIKYMMGHTDIKQTEEYIQSGELDVMKKAKQFKRR